MKKLLSVGIFVSVLLFIQGINSAFGCIEGERQALLKLKQSFKDPSNRLVSWTGEDCCHWRGVSCNRSNRHVVKLDLRVPSYLVFDKYEGRFYVDYNTSEQLSALQVDSCLAKLKHLEYLDLSGNDFNQSRIPEFFGSLKHLTYLNLTQAGFGGKIPHQLGNLTSLKVLDLSYGRMSFGWQLYADNFHWASNLLSLQHLHMSFVDLSKALDLMPVLNKLPSLVQLQLNGCRIQNIHFSHATVNSSFFASVQFLGLQGNELSGEIPKAFHNMTALRQLDLSYQWDFYSVGLLYADNLQWVSSLSSLQQLDMSDVNLSKALDLMQVLNTLPSLLNLRLDGCGIQSIHFSHATVNSTFFASVQYLYLRFNMFSGPVPNALKNMTELRELDLSYNNFNSSVPLCLVNSKSLVSLDIGWNDFDYIEGGLFSLLNNACSLKFLSLSDNPFRSEVLGSNKNSSSSCMSYSLESLGLSNTAVSGNIPEWLGKLQSLKYLFLSENSLLSGPIPSSIIELTLLRSLDLSKNQLDGSIPQSLGRLSALESLYLSNNRLSGEIPESLGRLSALEGLDLSHNRLNRSIPDSIGKLVSLHTFDVSYNSLEGVLSERNFANLSSLKRLDISSNRLICKMRSDWNPPFSLHYVNMSSCVIGSQFPQWLKKQKEVSELDLSNANISGGFPVWLYGIDLYYLDLSTNQISKSLTENAVEAIPHIEILLLGNNLMKGTMSNSLCKLENLQVLDLSNNTLSGEIPDCWRVSQLFVVIKLSYNKLSGTIPRSIGGLFFFKWLHLNGNNLGGEIPLALRNCQNLELLDLGENNISGAIPAWIGESLPSLKILRLRKNMFHGTVPLQLCQLSEMQILDLALNVLSGGIPHCFGKLSGMTTGSAKSPQQMTVSDGPIASAPTMAALAFPPGVDDDTLWHKTKVSVVMKGKALEYTTTLRLLDSMDLSGNKLDGFIPEELGALSGLRNLNLSRNRLTGKIPNNIGGLKAIESLDLSDNQLFGSIPQSMSTLLSLNHLNLSYNNLSGKIPTGNQLQTLDNSSSYAGNPQLCGFPLPKNCDEPANPPTNHGHKDEDKSEKIWFYFVVVIGYATGLWAVIGTLVFKRNWRVAYFRFVDNTKERMLGAIEVKVARLKKKMESIVTSFGV